MTAFVALLFLGLGVALPTGAFYFAGRRAWKQLGAAEAYREVAQQLGLRVDTRGISVNGYLGRRRLWIGEVMEGWGPQRQVVTLGLLSLEFPLGLGLLARRRGLRARLRRRNAQLDLGDEALDKQLLVHGDDRGRVSALLRHPEVRRHLAALMQRWPEVTLTDHAVRVLLREPETSPLALRTLIDAMQRLVEALELARLDIAPPDALVPFAREFATLAPELGLDHEPALPLLRGELDGRAILVSIRRQEDGYRASVRLAFAPHPELGLRLSRQLAPDGSFAVGQDIQVGDPDFDRTFIVKGWDPYELRARLTAEARGGLLALQAAGSVDLDDHALSTRDLPLDTAVIAEAVRGSVRVAVALGW